jgi:hypothetical protein
VAVKIVEYTQEPGQRGPLEGLLSEQVQHPNVVSPVLAGCPACAQQQARKCACLLQQVLL